MILGGGYVQNYKASSALGTNPASASATVVVDTANGGSFSLGIGSYVIYAFGSFATFHGIVTSAVRSDTDPESGSSWAVEFADNRIRLQWQQVFGQFNIEDLSRAKNLGRPESPSAPGDSNGGGSDDVQIGSSIDSTGPVEGYEVSAPDADTAGAIRRRYWSILPKDWKSGIKTWHDEPFTAREILNFAFDGAWGDFGFTRNYHPALSDVILTGLDYSSGIRLANLISSFNEQAGLEIAMSGSRSLVWYRRGVGMPPVPDVRSREINTGSALTANDTAVRIVGEPIRIQVANVAMEPDWKEGWEPFIDEVAWLREVAATWEMPNATKADFAEISAKAREVTVWDYAKKKAAPALLDYRMWGMVARNQMPAWLYLQEIVYRSYRIPPEKTLYGIPLSSLTLADSLICGTELRTDDGGESKQDYVSNPVDFYPSTQAQVIAKGQPIDLIDSRDIRSFYAKRATDLRNTWTTQTDFTVDAENMSIRFGSPVVIDGAPGSGKSLYRYPNRGDGGTNLSAKVSGASDYLDVVLPNEACELSPASVKASFCFLFAARYHKDYGSGPRRGSMNVPGLSLHLVDVQGTGSFAAPGVADFSGDLPFPSAAEGSFREILYQDGVSAEEKADAAAASVTGLSAVEASGGFKREGVAGTSVSGVVDRVTVTVDMAGLTEEISFTKARPSGITFSDRTLTRIQRTADLIQGQQELKNEARQYRTLSALLRQGGITPKPTIGRQLTSVFQKPVGSDLPSTQIVYNRNSAAPSRSPSAWKAGDLVWLDADGVPSLKGTAFGGVLVIAPRDTGNGPAKELVLCHSGTVPVRCKPGILPGGMVMADPGDYLGGPRGSIAIGRLVHAEATPDVDGGEVLAMVKLGSGGKPGGRFIVTHDPAGSRLYVSEGTVGCSNAYYPSSFIRPLDVTLDGVKLSNDPPPFFEVGESGDFEVVCVFDSTKGRIELVNKEEPLHLNNCERGWLIATVSFKEEGGKFVIDKAIDQRWESDIPWQFNDQSIDCSSGGSSEDSNDSDESGNSDDSGGSTDSDESGGSNDSSDDGDSGDFSGDSSDESDESMDPCCGTSTNPIIRITEANVAVAGDGARNCFPSSGSAMVFVFVTVTISGNPCDCGNTYLRITARGVTIANVYLGLSPVGTFSYVGEIMASACEDLPIRACVYTSGVGVAEEDPCRGLLCCASTTAKAPPPCDESCDGDSGSGGSSEESSDDSGSGGTSNESNDSTDSSEDPGSGGSDDKNCIMQMPDGSYAAMSCFETGNNHLGHFMFDVPVTGRLTRVPIDRRFLFVCIPGTIRVTATETGSIRRAAATTMDGDHIVIHSGLFLRPATVNVTLVGIKKGADRPWDPRTQRQWLKNKAFYQKLNAEPPP